MERGAGFWLRRAWSRDTLPHICGQNPGKSILTHSQNGLCNPVMAKFEVTDLISWISGLLVRSDTNFENTTLINERYHKGTLWYKIILSRHRW